MSRRPVALLTTAALAVGALLMATGPALAQVTQAKAICAGCQVTQRCLAFALETHQVHGVWGGTSPEERQLLWRRAARSRPAGTMEPHSRPLAASATPGPIRQ